MSAPALTEFSYKIVFLSENALSTAVSEKSDRVGATESKLQSHKKANKIIVALNPIVRKTYRDDTAKRKAWEFATHVQRDEKPAEKPDNK